MAREAENIGARIRELREELGLTQRELADRLPGKTEGKDISRWENGKHRPSPDTLAAVADALGSTVADLHAGPAADREPRGPTPDPFATKSNGDQAAVLSEIAAAEERADARHAELLAQIADLRSLLEPAKTQGRQGQRKKAGH
jgi:transcriptional regulator with XRE-family HTH domain